MAALREELQLQGMRSGKLDHRNGNELKGHSNK